MNLRFEFQELSLLSQDGFNLRLEANGYAVIEYQEDGYWRIGAIFVEGDKKNPNWFAERLAGFVTPTWFKKNIEITRADYPHYYRDIYTAIEEKHSSDIQDRIRDELNEAGISIPDPNREHLELSAS